MIVASKGKSLISCDLSQAETWIVAWLAEEQNMKNFLLHSDIHTETASFLFSKPTTDVIKEERYIGKQNNHASSYDMRAFRMAQVINKRSDQPPFVTVTIAQCKAYQMAWHNLYNNIRVWHSGIKAQLNQNMTLVTPYGRKRVFFGAWDDTLFKAAYAHIPQSTVSDHFHGCVQPALGIKGGLLEIARSITSNEIKLVHDAHDSCMLECPKEVAVEVGEKVRATLRRPLIVNYEEVTIPVDLEIGERWGQMDKIK